MGSRGHGQLIRHLCCCFLLTVLACSSVWPFSRETVPHKLLQQQSFSQAVALHELLQCEYLSTGKGCSSVDPAHGHTSCQQPCSSSFQGFTGPARSLLQCYGVTASFGHPPALCEVLHALQGPHHALHHGCSTSMLLPHCAHHCGLQHYLGSGPWSTSPPSCTHLGVYRTVNLMYSLSSLCLLLHKDCFTHLRYITPETMPLLLRAQPCPEVDLSCLPWHYQTQAKFLSSAHKREVFPTPKPCPANIIQLVKVNAVMQINSDFLNITGQN